MRQTLEQGLSMLSTQICPQAVDRLLKFSEMLLEKNKVMNLTAVTEPMEVVTRHFLDCAVLMSRMISGEKVLDVGTGAGFPGLPLAILCPESEFVLIDALRKRMDFLNEVIDTLDLKNVKAIHARAEEFAREHRGAFDCAVSRAVADLSMLSELTLPLVKTGKRLCGGSKASGRGGANFRRRSGTSDSISGTGQRDSACDCKDSKKQGNPNKISAAFRENQRCAARREIK